MLMWTKKTNWTHFRIVFVPEEFLIEDEEDGSSPDLRDIGTKLGDLEEELGESDETLDHACLSDIQEQFEEWVKSVWVSICV